MRWIPALAGALLITSSLSLAAENIRLQGIFKNTVVITVDGQQRMLKLGQRSPEGIELLAVDKQQATLRINGEAKTLGLSQHIASSFHAAEKQQVLIPRGERGGYFVSGNINGIATRMLIDTGATVVALNGREARRIGIDYKNGQLTRVSTASGISNAYSVMLNSINVSGLVLRHIEAVVIEGAFPEEVLLGMSYLSRVSMREQNNVLYLENK